MTRLEAHPLVAAIPADARQGALEGCELSRVEHGTRLIKDGDEALHIFLLVSGAVRIYFERPDGAEITAKIIAAPSFFGEAEAMGGLRFMETVSALGPVEVLRVPIARFEELLARHAAFGHAVVRDLSARFAAAIYHEKSLAFDPVTVRLANFLLDHLHWSEADRFGAPQVVLTQEEMAAAIGVSRRSITKDISMWKEAGLLEKGARGYRVVDLEGLARFADPRRVGVHLPARR
jgi:CRP-like cAMP-binding protein